MGNIAQRCHSGHARSTLQGVQTALEDPYRFKNFRVRHPLFEHPGRFFYNLLGFFQEDFQHFRIETAGGFARGPDNLRSGRLCDRSRDDRERFWQRCGRGNHGCRGNGCLSRASGR